MTDPTAQVKRSKSKTVFIVIGIVVAVAIAGFIVLTLGITAGNIVSQNTPPSTVTISGKVETVGFGTHPTAVRLIDQRTGEERYIQVAGNHYQLDAPNGFHSWRIVVEFQGLLDKGTCDGGFVQYDNTFNKFMSKDVSC